MRIPQYTPLFPDLDKMREDLQQAVLRPSYDVSSLYKTSGFAQRVVRHPRFDMCTNLVIVFNALWIAIETDLNQASMLLDSAPGFQIAEHAFCVYFITEWALRFIAFERKSGAFCDFWFLFDTLLVSIMVIDVWCMTAVFVFIGGVATNQHLGNMSVLRLAKLFRLVRMGRIARLLRVVPELLILVKGMMIAMRSVICTLGLLFVIIYIFGIAFTQLCRDTPCEAFFSTVPRSMHVLLVNAALLDGLSLISKPLEDHSLWLLAIFYVFLFFAALTVMNMLIGVVCEVVSTVAALEKEEIQINFMKERLEELMNVGDSNGDKMISKEEFIKMLSNRKAVLILDAVGIDVVGLVDFVDSIFDADHFSEDGPHQKSLEFSEFMKTLLDLRGSNSATLKDIIELRKFVTDKMSHLDKRLSNLMPESPVERRLKGHSGASSPGLDPASNPGLDAFNLAAKDCSKKDHSFSASFSSATTAAAAAIDESLDAIIQIHRRELATAEAANAELMSSLRSENNLLKDDIKRLSGFVCQELRQNGTAPSCSDLSAQACFFNGNGHPAPFCKSWNSVHDENCSTSAQALELATDSCCRLWPPAAEGVTPVIESPKAAPQTAAAIASGRPPRGRGKVRGTPSGLPKEEQKCTQEHAKQTFTV